jgi:hypothetical protein
MRRRTTTLSSLALLLSAATLIACTPGSGSLGTVPTGPAATPSAAAPPSAPASPAPSDPAAPPAPPAPPPPPASSGAGSNPDRRTVTIAVWFAREGRLFYTTRTRPVTPATSRLALNELAAGPTDAEARLGVSRGVPADRALDVSISAGVATVNYSAAFYAGGRDVARLRQAQVVYTLTQFPTVSKVGFRSGGEPVVAPVGRADYADLLPAIVVTSPLIGQRVSSPVTVAGTANVFEATVSIRILDAGGAPLATTFTTATCGSGCRGDYSATVAYRVASEQRGTVQVYEVSAQDGSRLNVIDIPVTLVPSG